MGLGLSKPQRPAAVAALALCFPSLYTKFLRDIEQFAAENNLGDAASMGKMLKAYGTPLFVAGHLILTKGVEKQSTDWAYLFACVTLGSAFVQGHLGQSAFVPELVTVSGAGLVFFGLVNRWKAIAAGANPALANIAAAAGWTLIYLGVQMALIRAGVLKKPLPGLSLAALGQLASGLFGTANFTKFFMMVQAGGGGPWNDDAMLGQFLKITASTCLFTGNGLLLGWHKIKVPGEGLFQTLSKGAIASAALS